MPNGNEIAVLDRLTNKAVKVFLAQRNVALSGKLTGHDDGTITLNDGYGMTLIYKSRIISVTEDTDGNA